MVLDIRIYLKKELERTTFNMYSPFSFLPVMYDIIDIFYFSQLYMYIIFNKFLKKCNKQKSNFCINDLNNYTIFKRYDF